MPNETLLATTFVELADTLVDDFDMIDLLTLLTTRCVEILDVDEAGLMLALPPTGVLRVMAASSETMRLLELLELQHDEGPCLDAYRSGTAILNQDLNTEGSRWPRFTDAGIAAGFRVVHAVPMRLRHEVIGALNLFRSTAGELTLADTVAAQALADIATIAILQHRAAGEKQLLTEQLQTALDSRIVIEQAKGIIAHHQGIDMPRAFAALRSYARNNNARLSDIATALANGALRPDALTQ